VAKKVIVAGASGVVGQAAVRRFVADGWQVVGVSRRPNDIPGATLLPLDLLDEQACKEALGGLRDVTHVVYAALQEEPGLFPGWLDAELIERNGRMLRNFFEPVSKAASGLEHVSLLHGTKAYGVHHPDVGWDPRRFPLREREPRVEHRNFYWVQEEYLLERQRGASWGLTTLRPTVVFGDAPRSNMNPIPPIAVYAALLKERGEPLHFPAASNDLTIHEGVDADIVAGALAWAAMEPKARGEAFNVTNGDVFIWQNVWPAIAETLGMEVGENRPFSFVEQMPQLDGEWAAIVEKHGLRAPKSIVEYAGYNSLVYADLVLQPFGGAPVPIMNSTIKIRQAGFAECEDSEDMFRKLFRRLQERREIPPP
jgi:nucleoside-diphosphate-sugar epimerase